MIQKNDGISTLTSLMEKEDHEVVLAVSHGGACSNFLRSWKDPTEELKQGFGNCCIFVYMYENKKFILKDIIRQEDY